MKTAVLTILGCMLFSGCAQPKPPQWYYQDNHDPLSVCGYGSGENVSDAKQQAQGDLVSRVGVRIGTKFQSNVTSSGNDVTRNRSSDVQSENIFKEMINVAVTRYSEETSWWKHHHFVEACLSKTEIKTVLERSIEKQMAQLHNKDLYGECLNRAGRENYLKLIHEASSNVKLLSQYDPDGEYTEVFNELAQTLSHANQPPAFKVKSNDVQLTQLITPLISKYGIVVSDESNATLKVELKGEVIRDSTVGKKQKNYLYVAHVVFQLENGCQAQLYQGSFKSVDEAKISKAAKINALNKLVKGVEHSTLSIALSQY